MADWEEKLQSILSNPQAMGQIAALAQSFSQPAPAPAGPDPGGEHGPEGSTPDRDQGGDLGAEWVPVSPPQEGEENPSAPLFGPGDGQAEGAGPLGALGALGDLDPRLLRTALGVLAAYRGEDDRKTALLNALRPYLKPERWDKVDQAIRIARLSRVIRTALQLLREEGQEEDGHV